MRRQAKARTVTIFNRFGMRRGADRAPSGHRLAFPLALIATALGLLFAASPAFAERTFKCQITGTTPVTSEEIAAECNGAAGSAPDSGGLNAVTGITEDGSGNLWVAGNDGSNSFVNEFSSAGAWLHQNDGTGSWSGSPYVLDVTWGSGAGLIYAADSLADNLWGLNLDATYASVDLNDASLGSECCFIHPAVDNSGGSHDGDIYVGTTNQSTGAVARIDGADTPVNFTASESYISGNKITGTPDHGFGNIEDVAVDASGDVYVADEFKSEVDQFAPSGEFVRAYTGAELGLVHSVAIDPTNGHVLIGDSSHSKVREFTSTGTYLGSFRTVETPGLTFDSQALTVDSAGNAYVVDSTHNVIDVFGSFHFAQHTLSVIKAGSGGGTVASSPSGIECGSTCSAAFEETEEVTLTATANSGSSFTGWSGVAAEVNGCTTDPECVVTIPGSNTSLTASFAQNKPALSGEGAGALAQHTATLGGSVNPEGKNVTACKFEYGTTESYGSVANCAVPPGSGTKPVPVTAALSGLSPATTYHFRLVATNSGGTAQGTDHTFTTLADTCQTNSTLCPPPPPPPICANTPSLCPPPPPKPLLCKKGFKKHKVKGKFVCKKLKHRKKHHRK